MKTKPEPPPSRLVVDDGDNGHALLAIALVVIVLGGLCALLGACTSVQPIVTKPVDVLIPGMQEPCRPKPVPVPEWATDAVPAGASMFEKAKAMGVEILQRQAYEVDVRAALDGCTSAAPPVSAPATTVPSPAAAPTLGERFKSLFRRGP